MDRADTEVNLPLQSTSRSSNEETVTMGASVF
jgi:hypothetical protein